MSSSEINVTPFSATDPVKATVTSVGGASAGGTASSNKPTITGTGEPGQVVNLYDGVRWLGSTTVASDGTWSITATTALKAGKHSFTAICVGADGVNGLSSEPVSVTVPADTSTIPPTPVIGAITDHVGPVKGNVAPGGSTDDTQPTFTGSGAKPGDIVTIKDGSTPIGSAIVDASGNWSVTPDVSLSNGPHSITAVEKNPSTGATSSPSTATTIIVDTTVPNPPSSVHITDPSTGGNVPAGGTTTNPSPVISGTGKPGDIVTVTDGEKPIGSATVGSDGNWSVTPTPPLVDGSHNLTATEANPATGATSTPSPGISISVDSLGPVVPVIGSIIDAVGPGTGPLHPGDITNDPRPEFIGTGKPGATAIVMDGDKVVGTGVIDSHGNYSIKPTNPLPDGWHDFHVMTVDPVSGANLDSVHFPLGVILTPSQAAPTITGLIDDVGAITGIIPIGGTTDDPQPTLTGLAPLNWVPGTSGAYSKISVNVDGQWIGTTTVQPDGTWSFKLPPLAKGPHDVKVATYDGNGNLVGPSGHYPFTFDNSPANPATIGSVIDAVGPVKGPLHPGDITDDPRPTFTGTGTPGDTVTIMDGDKPIGSGVVDANGNYSIQPKDPLTDGQHDLHVIPSTPAGVPGPDSAHFPVGVITTPTGAATIGGLADHVGPIQGNVPIGGTTDDPQPTFSGNGTPGDTVKIMDGGTQIGAAFVNANGTWTFTPGAPLSNGPHDLHVVAVNPAGVPGPDSGHYPFTLDSGPATAPAITGLIDAVGAITGLIAPGQSTDDTRPVLSGIGHAGDIVTIKDGNSTLGSATVGADGKWSFQPATALPVGNHDLSATATNAAGNTSVVSPHYPFSIDTTASATKPVITLVLDSVGPATGGIWPNGTTDDPSPAISGTGHAGDTIVVKDGSGILGTTIVGTDGKWSYKPPFALADGGHDFFVTATNAVGSTADSVHVPIVVNTTVDQTASTAKIVDTTPNPIGSQWYSYGGTGQDVVHITGTPGQTYAVYVNGVKQPTYAVPGGSGPTSTVGITIGADGTGLALISGIGQGTWVLSSDGGKTFSEPFLTGQFNYSPYIRGVYDAVGTTYGMVPSGGSTDDNMPTIQGRGGAGTTVSIYEGSTLLGTVSPNTAGEWSLKLTTPLPVGAHTLTVSAWNQYGGTKSGYNSYTFTVAPDSTSSSVPAPTITQMVDAVGAHKGPVASGGTTDDPNAIIKGTAPAGATVSFFDNGTYIGHATADDSGKWSFRPSLTAGSHELWAYTNIDNVSHSAISNHFTVTVAPDAPATRMATEVQAPAHEEAASAAVHHETFAIDNAASYFTAASGHVEGHSGLDTVALTGDHQILDLTALTGKTAAAKISGVEVFDLGGHQNTLKVSLLDVLNLGEQDLFVQDGKQQIAVKGAAGDAVDLSNTHVAGVADGQWAQHGTAQVGGVTYAVFEHSGAHVELLVQQGVATTVHQ